MIRDANIEERFFRKQGKYERTARKVISMESFCVLWIRGKASSKTLVMERRVVLYWLKRDYKCLEKVLQNAL